jgi:cellulose synthase/poly-beta-1,6-N-acetylglucosamine synthase-like glycosyltransferase
VVLVWTCVGLWKAACFLVELGLNPRDTAYNSASDRRKSPTSSQTLGSWHLAPALYNSLAISHVGQNPKLLVFCPDSTPTVNWQQYKCFEFFFIQFDVGYGLAINCISIFRYILCIPDYSKTFIMNWVRQNLKAVLMFISLVVNNVDYHFMAIFLHILTAFWWVITQSSQALYFTSLNIIVLFIYCEFVIVI